MVDINLHKAAEKELKIKRKKSIFKSSSFISFSLLAIVVVAFGATMMYQSALEGKKNELLQSEKVELDSIDLDMVNELVDFQERTDSIVDNLNSKGNPKDMLDSVERLLVKGVFLNSLVYDGDKDTIEMEAVSDSFKMAASQMLSLKKSEIFSDVKILDSGRDESGRVVFSLEADIKN